MSDLRLHDLRRTGASRLEELEVADDTIEALLGHSRPSLRKTYRPSAPLKKMTSGLKLLADHYTEVLGPAWWEPDKEHP